MSVVVHSESLLQLVDRDVRFERLGTGFIFTEGPIWNAVESALYFNDLPGDVRRRWDETYGVVEVRRPNNKANGMAYDHAGRLVVCEHVTSCVVVETADGKREILASHFESKELNSPNDVVVAADGSIYFTDPSFGRQPVFGVERPQELDFQGVYRVRVQDGQLELLADDFEQPNGLCFSPDGSRLYVNDTMRAHIRVFDVGPDGEMSGGGVFFEGIGRGAPDEGAPDGMKCDAQGNVYVTGPGGIWVVNSDAAHLGVIEIPEVAANLNWGDRDWQTLYVTASTSLYRIRMKVQGAPTPYMRAVDGRIA